VGSRCVRYSTAVLLTKRYVPGRSVWRTFEVGGMFGVDFRVWILGWISRFTT